MGVRIQYPPLNNPLNPASGPECSVPAIGWPGTKSTSFGSNFSEILLKIFLQNQHPSLLHLVLNDSDIFFITLEKASTGTPIIIMSASLTVAS